MQRTKHLVLAELENNGELIERLSFKQGVNEELNGRYKTSFPHYRRLNRILTRSNRTFGVYYKHD